jgi:hypothetical protein
MMHRGVSSTIWRTVVMAGAMLSAQACGGSANKPAPVTPAPAPEATTEKPADPAPPAAEPAAVPVEAAEPAAAANPCGGPEADKPALDVQASDKPAAKPAKKKKRPRGSGDKPVGRGFVLA